MRLKVCSRSYLYFTKIFFDKCLAQRRDVLQISPDRNSTPLRHNQRRIKAQTPRRLTFTRQQHILLRSHQTDSKK